MADEYLWPTRNVAEYAYCPRLFYLMEVEGIHLPSADTEKARATHRRVDQPSEFSPDDDPGAPRRVRSLTLTSRRLQLTATLDLAEVSGNVAVPVEYRKGQPSRRVASTPGQVADQSRPPKAWPTDRIQIGLQAMLLEEAGYDVPKGVIYYAGEKLRLDIAWNDALRQESQAILQAAQNRAAGARPPPLVNDPRCPRCSLQPVCLPDEVNYARTGSDDGGLTPRRIWPPREDGIIVIVQHEGGRIGVSGASLYVRDKDGTLIKEVPLPNVESLSILGPVQISTQAIHELADHGIPIAYLSSAGRMVAMIDPLDSVSALVRRAQIQVLDQPAKCLELARSLAGAKVLNQRTILMRNHDSLPEGVAAALMSEAREILGAETMEAVRGHEGQAAAIYFAHLPGVFSEPLASEFRANGRQRRPPPDPINSCLSMTYTMLTHECTTALRLARLEPSIGVFHVSRPGRPALALDLMEPFRPLIADSIAISAFNRNELTEGHFQRTAAGCLLTNAGRKAFFDLYGRRLESDVTHPVFGYKLSYRRMLTLHARMIAAWLIGDIPSLSFLTTR